MVSRHSTEYQRIAFPHACPCILSPRSVLALQDPTSFNGVQVTAVTAVVCLALPAGFQEDL